LKFENVGLQVICKDLCELDIVDEGDAGGKLDVGWSELEGDRDGALASDPHPCKQFRV